MVLKSQCTPLPGQSVGCGLCDLRLNLCCKISGLSLFLLFLCVSLPSLCLSLSLALSSFSESHFENCFGMGNGSDPAVAWGLRASVASAVKHTMLYLL